MPWAHAALPQKKASQCQGWTGLSSPPLVPFCPLLSGPGALHFSAWPQTTLSGAISTFFLAPLSLSLLVKSDSTTQTAGFLCDLFHLKNPPWLHFCFPSPFTDKVRLASQFRLHHPFPPNPLLPFTSIYFHFYLSSLCASLCYLNMAAALHFAAE